MKKKIGSKFIITVLSLSLVLGVLPGIAFAKGGTLSGDGSKDNPYQIYDYQDLKAFAQIVNGTHPSIGQNRSAWAVLEADIVAKNNAADAQYARDWTPIGSDSDGYLGTFDGTGHTITGLSTPENYAEDYVGLFGYLNHGLVKNVGLKGGNISGNSSVGGVAGTNLGTIMNCYNTGAVSGDNRIGGVAGWNSDTIKNCYNTGAVSGGSPIGGVAGIVVNDSTTVECSYFGKEICKGLSAVGEKAEGTISNTQGLKTEEMTGAKALENMKFDYESPDDNPWMVKANTDKFGFYPHLKGFNWEKDGEGIRQMSPDKILPKDWPAKIEFDTPDPKEEETKVSGIPLSTMTAKGKNSLVIKWAEVKGADGYDIFFSECNHNDKKSPKKNIKTINSGKTLSWTKKGLKKGSSFKACVKAFVMKNGKKVYVGTSPAVHAFTGGYTKVYTNAKAVKVNKTKVTLSKGKTIKIKAKVIKLKKDKKLMPKSHAPKLRYLTTDKKIATVSSKGKIKAKGKGTCYVYVYAHNGVSKKIKVTVK